MPRPATSREQCRSARQKCQVFDNDVSCHNCLRKNVQCSYVFMELDKQPLNSPQCRAAAGPALHTAGLWAALDLLRAVADVVV
ncbi:hypothetical protein BDV98DRAFT_121272 [Pterulicium gracile]|uniref:Zn(2)-C6 fungal-type domain-containing protein n=1 Tax=Pterulicium gracile TaxID=1884261 RepID=A0A5C3QIW4_9AGAR|nr:hypothetical protein BDV98DRAFT_121272 [Pterula gracilis]